MFEALGGNERFAKRTDFATGESLIVWVWKLKGLRGFVGGGSRVPSPLSRGETPAEESPVEERPAEEGIGEFIAPNRGEKVSEEEGERALRSRNNRLGGGAARDAPSIPNPDAPNWAPYCSSGVGDGGVGVRGGAGMGNPDAIVAICEDGGIWYHELFGRCVGWVLRLSRLVFPLPC